MSFKMFPGKFMTSTRNQSERRSCLITWGRVFTYEHPKAGKILKQRVLTTPEKFENAVLFLPLGLPSTLIMNHENRAFRKRSSNRRNFKTPAF